MASVDPYPMSSIVDDFNYGSNVASASIHIRMGEPESLCAIICPAVTDLTCCTGIHYCLVWLDLPTISLYNFLSISLQICRTSQIGYITYVLLFGKSKGDCTI